MTAQGSFHSAARLYQGVQFAIVQTPLTRFGVAAANVGIMHLLAPASLPIGITTALASAAGCLWRLCITPLDTLKTTLQVEGVAAYALIVRKVRKEGPTVLYQGALANTVAAFVGSFPWWFTFHLATRSLPTPPPEALGLRLVRSAVAGVLASFVADVVSNSLRVLKVTRQTAAVSIGYVEAARRIIDKDGALGLFTRGLRTRLVANGLQASVFAVVWKYLEIKMSAGGDTLPRR